MRTVDNIKTIALVGPQSTGKSTLSGLLAEKYKTIWVPEFARQYFAENNRQFTYEDVTPIAKGQIAGAEQGRLQANHFLFCDTDALTTLIWSDIYFGKYPKWLSEHIEENPHDLYLLMDMDLAFERESQREGPEMQAVFMEKFRYYLNKFKLPYELLGGYDDSRLVNASLICEAYFTKYERFTFFMEPFSPFSQWFTTSFTVDDVNYCCAEQYMMYHKALLFNDTEIARRIMQSNLPFEHQSLGRAVRNFDSLTWKKHCKSIVYKGNYAKFSQNRELWHLLHDTKETLLVEAYEHCNYWSAGLNEKDPRIHDRTMWKGKNWVGFILTKVRDDLMENEKQDNYLL